MTATLVLAHQGGWDEILLVAGPILLFVILLARANKRAEQQTDDQNGSVSDPDSDSGHP